MLIRLAEEKDLDQIMKIVSASIKRMRESGSDQWDENYPQRDHYYGDIQEHSLYVYEENNNILGVACYSEHNPSEYNVIKWSSDEKAIILKRLAVSPEYRNKGIGKQFYRHIEHVAQEKGISYLKTDTYSKNPAAQKVFLNAGYSFVGELYTPDKPYAFYCYEKKLKEKSAE